MNHPQMDWKLWDSLIQKRELGQLDRFEKSTLKGLEKYLDDWEFDNLSGNCEGHHQEP